MTSVSKKRKLLPNEQDRGNIQDLLNESDNIAKSQKVIKPTEKEKQEISKFCTLTLQIKELQKSTKSQLVDVKPEIKHLRKEILEFMKEHSLEVLKMSEQVQAKIRKRKRKDDEDEDDEDKEESEKPNNNQPPKFIRIVKNAKDLTISLDVVKDALLSISEDDILDSQKEVGSDALVECFIDCVRRNIRSFNEQIKLTDTAPRGLDIKIMDVAPNELKKNALILNEKLNLVLSVEKDKREQLKVIKEKIQDNEDNVKKYFQRCQLNSQRIHIESTTYSLGEKVRASKPKLSLKVLQNILEDSLKNWLFSSRRFKNAEAPPTKEDLIEFMRKPTRVPELEKILLDNVSEYLISGKEENKKSVLTLKKIN
jgi:hypothetical protein